MGTTKQKTVILAAMLTAALNVVAVAEPMGTAFTYQGQLKDGGVPVTDSADFEFSVWDATTGGVQVGSTLALDDQDVVNGLFSVKLDFGAEIFTGDARWLKISVCSPAGGGQFSTLSPRQELTPSPYSSYAGSAGSSSGSGDDRTPISSLPFTITQPGSYYVTGDLTSASDGIIVEADHVTIDLMGFSISGPGSGTNYGVWMETRNNVEVRNGTVRSFGAHGICDVGNPYRGHEHRVVNVRVLFNGGDGINLPGRSQLVQDCTASENGGSGIYAGYDSTVTGNTAWENGASGIGGGNACTITGNNSSYNGSTGLAGGMGSTMTENTVVHNQGMGVSAAGGCTVLGNTVRYNDWSGMDIGDGCTVMHNTVHANNRDDVSGHAGILIRSYSLIKSNTISENLRCGIDVNGTGVGNSIEENLISVSSIGIEFFLGGNFYANNRVAGCGEAFVNAAGNIDGGGNYDF